MTLYHKKMPFSSGFEEKSCLPTGTKYVPDREMNKFIFGFCLGAVLVVGFAAGFLWRGKTASENTITFAPLQMVQSAPQVLSSGSGGGACPNPQ